MTITAKTHLIIHAFAVAHALACFFLYNSSIGDAVVLSCLTIAMVITVVRLHSGPMGTLFGLLLLSCMAGFYLGTSGAKWIGQLFPAMPLLYTHVLTTALVTEVLGWSLFFVVKKKNA